MGQVGAKRRADAGRKGHLAWAGSCCSSGSVGRFSARSATSGVFNYTSTQNTTHAALGAFGYGETGCSSMSRVGAGGGVEAVGGGGAMKCAWSDNIIIGVEPYERTKKHWRRLNHPGITSSGSLHVDRGEEGSLGASNIFPGSLRRSDSCSACVP
ncbi:unnamed protein product [Lampetra planeri]